MHYMCQRRGHCNLNADDEVIAGSGLKMKCRKSVDLSVKKHFKLREYFRPTTEATEKREEAECAQN